MNFEHQNIHFASDLHLFHSNVIKYDGRPFKDVDEMHEEIIKRWNSVVQPNHVVYNTGDLSCGNHNKTKWIMDRLNGKMYHIMGNHDRLKDILKLDRFESVHEYGTEIWVKDEDIKGYQQIILTHYPILEWNRTL